MNSDMRSHVLERLARTTPADLLRQEANGSRNLSNLYVECCNVRLTDSTQLDDDVGRLQTLFTVANDHGLPHMVTDYLQEICLDENVTSR